MQVYIGPGQYFVTSDIGRGRMQWYAFLALPPGSKSREDNIKYLKDVSHRCLLSFFRPCFWRDSRGSSFPKSRDP